MIILPILINQNLTPPRQRAQNPGVITKHGLDIRCRDARWESDHAIVGGAKRAVDVDDGGAPAGEEEPD